MSPQDIDEAREPGPRVAADAEMAAGSRAAAAAGPSVAGEAKPAGSAEVVAEAGLAAEPTEVLAAERESVEAAGAAPVDEPLAAAEAEPPADAEMVAELVAEPEPVDEQPAEEGAELLAAGEAKPAGDAEMIAEPAADAEPTAEAEFAGESHPGVDAEVLVADAGPGPESLDEANGESPVAETDLDGADGDLPALTEDADLDAALESLLLVVDSPVEEEPLADALGQNVARVTGALERLAAQYSEHNRGLDLRRVGGGWRFYTRDRYAPYVERLLLDGQRAKLTRAALETLAVIAYRQPVTRARVAAVRGVNCDGVIRTLLARGLVEETGTDLETGGFLYRTTELFLERLGLSTLDDLPPIAPLLPEVDAIDDI